MYLEDCYMRNIMKIRTKLVIAFLSCGLIPLVVACVVGFMTGSDGMSQIQGQSSQALESASFNQLIALHDVKKRQIETYFNDREGDMGVLVDVVDTLRNEAFSKLDDRLLIMLSLDRLLSSDELDQFAQAASGIAA